MIISESWDGKINIEFYQPYFLKLVRFLEREYANYRVFPPKHELFNAFTLTPYENVKVVILGQDPYHEEGQAHGLCFSVKNNVPFPPSLQNIFRELKNDLGISYPKSGDLTKWAQQGVLLLNAVLSVRQGFATSHKDMGWEQFTDFILKLINDKQEPVVYILWGKYAINKAALLTNPHHLIITGPHPSPLSAYRGFFGGKYFSKCNQFLASQGIKKIDWNLNY
ncbi:MAG TPA: uracil-DNA glycosylase [Bacilli bacterium]|nr:uracil-DNA glycosylase [Bacilli bacterium]